jgi:ribosomal protein S18 acetylase RimI-like enzyme
MASPVSLSGLFEAPQVTDLRRISAPQIAPVLEDQRQHLLEELGWDFTPSMAILYNLVDQRDLSGYALRYSGKAVGFCYSIVEERKGILGDMHLQAPFRTAENENLLMEATLRDVMRIPGIRRVEAQILTLTSPFERSYPATEYLRHFQREVMEVNLSGPRESALDVRGFPVNIVAWNDRMLEDAGVLMARAYDGHIDGRINDQYRNGPVAQRFLQNIVEHPGCGSFCAGASFAAYGSETRRLEGMSLASLVGPGMGHITQICVSPEARGRRLGFRLLDASLHHLKRLGCERASLSVTSWNREARDLYQRMGFVRKRLFNASIWDGFC